MNSHAQGLHDAHEDERTRHVRAVKTEQKEREDGDRARRRVSALVAPRMLLEDDDFAPGALI